MRLPTVLLLSAACAASGCAPPGQAAERSGGQTAAPRAEPDSRLRRLIADYTGLWRRETLSQWEQLFLPGFTVASTNADGSITVRTREEFFAAQRRYHERVNGLREDLENVTIEQRGRLASVWADYVVAEGSGGPQRRGRLVLLAIEERGEFRLHSLMFSYHG
jgi:hypothetical protein